MIKISFVVPQIPYNNITTKKSLIPQSSDDVKIVDKSVKETVNNDAVKIEDFKPYDSKSEIGKNFYEVQIKYDNVMKYSYFSTLLDTYKSTSYIYTYNSKYNSIVIKVLKFMESGSSNYLRNVLKHMCNKIEKYIETNNNAFKCVDIEELNDFIWIFKRYNILNQASMLNYDIPHNKKLLNGAESIHIMYNELNDNTISTSTASLSSSLGSVSLIDGDLSHHGDDFEFRNRDNNDDYDDNNKSTAHYSGNSYQNYNNNSNGASYSNNGQNNIRLYNGILGYSNVMLSCKAILQSYLTNCLKKTSQNALWIYYICYTHKNIFDEFLLDRCLFYIDKYKTINDANLKILIACPLQVINNILKRKTMYIKENIICDLAIKWYCHNKNKPDACTVFKNISIKYLTCSKYKELLNLDDNAANAIIPHKFNNPTERGLFIAKQDYMIYFEKNPIYKNINNNGILLDILDIKIKPNIIYICVEMPFIWNGLQKKYIIYNITINYNFITNNRAVNFYHVSPEKNNIEQIIVKDVNYNELYKSTIFTFNDSMSLDSLRLVIEYPVGDTIHNDLESLRFVLSSELYT